jgi:hypothetical protein
MDHEPGNAGNDEESNVEYNQEKLFFGYLLLMRRTWLML